ncbi:hypothetical protein C2S52_006950 [Perilla frutescens var. hirtella]|nr:hypothetical protein C2S51_008897 [Perilla frutescens var. frutescens]KAH6787398.1 hypothetical protein C2S52_006950 [Perilla frutescens var. hirtella]
MPDSWAAAPRSSPPGFTPKACTSAAARLSRNQHPSYDGTGVHGETETSNFSTEEEPPRRNTRKRSRPQFYTPPTAPKPVTGIRRRGRPPKANSMSRLGTRNNNQISSIPSRRPQEEMPCFISSHKITKDQSSLRVNDQVSEHGSQINTSPSPHHRVGRRLKRKTDDISVDKTLPREVQRSSLYAEDIEETLIDISLTEVPGSVSCYEKTRNYGSNNQISEGIDPKILQHVANALQCMAESQTLLDDAKAISRSSDINKNLVHTLKAINMKHGDITQNCSLESDCMKTLVLLGICKVVQDLQKKQLKDLDISSLDSYYTAVRDAENMKVNVQWLRSRLDEIKDAFNLSDEAKSLIKERDRRVGNIDRKKKELSLRKSDLERLKYEVQDIEEQLARDSMMVEDLNTKFSNQMSKISQFQHANLMDGLI